MFKALEAYKIKFGHCNVSQLDSQYKRLGRWVNNQRTFRKKKKLDVNRETLLEKLGVIWDVKDYDWNSRLQMLKVFKYYLMMLIIN
jgi:hypothetical protein